MYVGGEGGGGVNPQEYQQSLTLAPSPVGILLTSARPLLNGPNGYF